MRKFAYAALPAALLALMTTAYAATGNAPDTVLGPTGAMGLAMAFYAGIAGWQYSKR